MCRPFGPSGSKYRLTLERAHIVMGMGVGGKTCWAYGGTARSPPLLRPPLPALDIQHDMPQILTLDGLTIHSPSLRNTSLHGLTPFSESFHSSLLQLVTSRPNTPQLVISLLVTARLFIKRHFTAQRSFTSFPIKILLYLFLLSIIEYRLFRQG